MAAVFLAHDLVLERQVAIKVLPPDMPGNSDLTTRFQQEAKMAARLDHPNIIPIYRVESEAGLVYMVMKYVSGHSLEELLGRGALPLPLVRHVLREAALALGHAHRRRIVHRDVKPANIMVDDENRVILTDFGISKVSQSSGQLTGSGTIIGTPHYMAPEQARGKPVDGRTDQYALAVVGYRVLTGKPPFDGDAHSILYQQVFEPPPSLLNLRPDTPHDLRVALDRALAKEAGSRFRTMEEFASAVSGERSGPVTAVSTPAVPTKPVKVVEPAAGHGAGVLVALATIALVASGAWLSLPTLMALTEKETVPAASLARSPAPRQAASTPPSRKPAAVVQTAKGKRGAPLSISSNPAGVVRVNGVQIGRTPINNHRLPPGTHRLRIERTGYLPLSETIVVKGSRPITRKYDLRRRTAR